MSSSLRRLVALAALVFSASAARAQHADSALAARPSSPSASAAADPPRQAVLLGGVGPSHRLGLVGDLFVGGETARWEAGLRVLQEFRIVRVGGLLLPFPEEIESTEAIMLYGARIYRDGSSRTTLGAGAGVLTVENLYSGDIFSEPIEWPRSTVHRTAGVVLTAERRVRLIRIGRAYGFHLRVAPVVLVSPRSTFATLTLGAAHVITLR